VRRKLRKYPFLVIALIAAIAAASAFAFANAIGGVNPPLIGSGSDPIDKYTLGTPVYTLNANSPRSLDSVSFTLAGATTATVVTVQLAGNWYSSCSSTAAPTITCTTTAPQATAVGANNTTLQVVAKG